MIEIGSNLAAVIGVLGCAFAFVLVVWLTR